MRLRSLALAAATLLPLPAAAQPARLDAPARRAIVDSLAAVLERAYVDSATAVRLGAVLRARQREGAYETFGDAEGLAGALMRDVQAVVPDKHLRVTWEPRREFAPGAAPAGGGGQVVVMRPPPAGGGAPGPGGAAPWRRVDPRDSLEVARANFGFDAVERLPGNVGYLRLSRFVPTDWAEPTAAAAMGFLSSTDAVILDLRGNLGGSPAMMELLLSYFLPPEPVVLLRARNRALGLTVEHRSRDVVPGRRLGDVPLFVLQDRNSASTAEMLPYVVRQRRMGTVVGDTSAGAGNGGNMLSLGAGVTVFVPQFAIVTGPGYERTGVAPDVAVPAAQAREVAHRLALRALVAAASDSLVRREREWALELLEAAPPALDARALGAYAGRFPPRRFEVADGVLVHVGSTGVRTPLRATATDTFRGEAARFHFERGADGAVVAVRVVQRDGRVSRLARGGEEGGQGRT